MPDVSLVYIGPSSLGIEHPVTGEIVRRNEPFEVPDELAGKAPSGKSPGEGLLAQTDNFRAHGAAKKES